MGRLPLSGAITMAIRLGCDSLVINTVVCVENFITSCQGHSLGLFVS